jgi:hypothetical protein
MDGPNPRPLIARWRRFAQRWGLGCIECGRRFFLKTDRCRAHLDAEFKRAMHEVIGGVCSGD